MSGDTAVRQSADERSPLSHRDVEPGIALFLLFTAGGLAVVASVMLPHTVLWRVFTSYLDVFAGAFVVVRDLMATGRPGG
ncbi:MAG: hypothetical protein P8049_03690 [Gemmatimonadota bacterium]